MYVGGAHRVVWVCMGMYVGGAHSVVCGVPGCVRGQCYQCVVMCGCGCDWLSVARFSNPNYRTWHVEIIAF